MTHYVLSRFGGGLYKTLCLLAVLSVGYMAMPEAAAHTPSMMIPSELAVSGGGEKAASWSVIPFVVLLLSIAIFPLIAPHFWHHHYPKVAIGLGLITGSYYLFGLQDYISVVHVGFEYFSFIGLLSSLFVAAGGIVINIDKKSSAKLNVMILAFGAVIANVIGTTGAAMLLIRPFMRANKGRLKAYHIVFFIFIVANVGGALTPIGDPPLFLGFLKGIDFFLFGQLNFVDWVLALAILLTIFFVFDSRNKEGQELQEIDVTNKIGVKGATNFFFLAAVIGSVFLDPNKIAWLPAVTITDPSGQGIIGLGWGSDKSENVEVFGFVREIIQFSIAVIAFKVAKTENLEANGFNFEPIKEVGYLFIGIFLTMIPALAMIKEQAAGGDLFGLPLTPTTFYFGTGILSGFLDNAPTFLAFLAGLEGKAGMSAAEISNAILMGAQAIPADANVLSLIGLPPETAITPEIQEQFVAELAYDLTACAVAAVFWGAFTYIGNGPNFMVKAIADASTDENGDKLVHTPSFFGYMGYSCVFLLPVLIIVYLVSFSGLLL